MSNFTDLIELANLQVKLFSLGPYLLTSKFRKRKRQFLCCVHLLHKAGSCEIWKFHVPVIVVQ